jgi:hypothetical protein
MEPDTLLDLIERAEKLGPIGLFLMSLVLCAGAFGFLARRMWGRTDEAEKRADELQELRLQDRKEMDDLTAKVEAVLREHVASTSQRAAAWEAMGKVVENSGRILEAMESKWSAGEQRLLTIEHRAIALAESVARLERLLERSIR